MNDTLIWMRDWAKVLKVRVSSGFIVILALSACSDGGNTIVECGISGAPTIETGSQQSMECSGVVRLNENSWAPLTGIAEFCTDVPSRITITVLADEEGGTAVTGMPDSRLATQHSLPILGLYAGRTNVVEIAGSDGGTEELFRLRCEVQTGEIPDEANVPEITIETDRLEENERSLLFVGGNGGDFVFDRQGNIRWYLGHAADATTDVERAGLVYNQLDDGLLAVGMERHSEGESPIPYWYGKVAEMDWLGNITRVYELPDYVHHSVEEIQGNRLLIASSRPGTTGEDVVLKFDRTTESTDPIATFDFNRVLSRGEIGGLPNDRLAVGGGRADDWAHINAIAYDSVDTFVIFSVRQQSALVKIELMDYEGNTDLKWILGYPERWGDSNDDELLLSGKNPEADWPEWPYGQHSVQSLPGSDNFEERLLVFDNGTNRGSLDSTVSVTENQLGTNRAVEYLITYSRTGGRTAVSKTWEFMAPETGYTSPILGSVRELDTGNRLILFPAPPSGTLPTTVIEVDGEEVLFQATLPQNYNRTFAFHARVFSFYD